MHLVRINHWFYHHWIRVNLVQAFDAVARNFVCVRAKLGIVRLLFKRNSRPVTVLVRTDVTDVDSRRSRRCNRVRPLTPLPLRRDYFALILTVQIGWDPRPLRAGLARRRLH